MESTPTVKLEDARRTQKEMLWQQKMSALESTVDGLGLGLDEGIKEAVAAFNVLGFNTRQSCEGHVYSDDELPGHGLPFPWVSFEAPGEPDEQFVGQYALYQQLAEKYGITFDAMKHWDHDEALEEYWASVSDQLTPEYSVWAKEQEKYLKRVESLVNEFNESHVTDEDTRLRIGFDRVHNGGPYMTDREYERGVEEFRQRLRDKTASTEEIHAERTKLAARQREMQVFSAFLKQKFFAQR